MTPNSALQRTLLLSIALFLSSCEMKIDDEALPLMNDGQRKTVEILELFDSATSPEQIATSLGVDGTMGAPHRADFVLVHDGAESHVRAYYVSGSLDKIQYLSMSPMWGYSVYYTATGESQ